MSPSIKLSLAVVIVGMVLMLDTARSCDCLTYHPQLGFCRGQLAYRFTVIAADHVNASRYDQVVRSPGAFQINQWRYDVQRRYTITGFKLYQGNKELNTNTSVQYIYTDPNPGFTCGASLTTGSYAVIGGSYRNGHLSIYSCDNIEDLSALSLRERTFVLINWIYRFPRACQHCQVVECSYKRAERCQVLSETMSFQLIVFLAVVVVSMLDPAQSCSCDTQHPQQEFCHGALAYRFKVIAADHVRENDQVLHSGDFPRDYWPLDVARRYTINRFHLYQGNKELTTNTSIQYIYTDPNPGWTCGASLTTGNTYAVIGGSYRNGQLSVYNCANIFDLETLSLRERQFLLINWVYRFPTACQHCRIVECLEDTDSCEGEQSPDECRLYASHLKQPTDLAVCLRRGSYCVWVDGFQVIPSREIPSL